MIELTQAEIAKITVVEDRWSRVAFADLRFGISILKY